VVENGCAQRFQHFISNSPWDHEPVVAQIARDADALLGGKPDSALIIDESSFPKQGKRSVGVARQWSGRLGKVDNCQVAVFGVLTDGKRHTAVDMRLYLPRKPWIDDPARCERAGIPENARAYKSKSEHALDIVRRARERGMRFEWVGVDGGYGKEPALDRTSRPAHSRADVRPRPSVEEAAGLRGVRHRGSSGQGARPEGVDAPNPARGHARNVAGRNRDPAGLGLGRR